MAKRLATIVLASSMLGLIAFMWPPITLTATINWMDVHQVIDGFGGSCADFTAAFSPAMADFFFTTSGIGLSLLRTQIVPDLADCKANFPGCNSNGLILDGELAIAQQAVARGVTVWSTPWSPASAYKSNGSFTNGGYLLPAHYSEWAMTIARYVTMMRAHGVPVTAVSVQNEPDLSTPYGSCTYSAEQIHDFVPYLHSALESVGAGSAKIMIAEASRWDFSLATAAVRDPAVAATIGILAAHGYGNANGVAPANYGKHVWQTEDSSQSSVYDGSIEDGLAWASKIHTYLTVANVNAWHWWFLSNGPNFGNGMDNSALTDINLHYPKRAYVTGQWSKFVRPGWVRIGVSYFGSLQISAFKAPTGQEFAIVVVNRGRSRAQTFALKGTVATSVTPWVTSAARSLEEQKPVAVSNGRFTYILEGSSVITFSGGKTASGDGAPSVPRSVTP